VSGEAVRFMDEWRDRVITGYHAEVAAGKHDGECEWRESGHFICNCAMRRRIASGYTEPPGELIHQYPLCPRCDHEVSHDGDSFICDECACYWPDGHGTAQFFDDHGDLSESVAKYDARQAS